MKYHHRIGSIRVTPVTVLIVALLGLLMFPFLAIWTDRSLEFWAFYFKGVPVEIPYWISLAMTILLNVVIVGFNVLTELARLIL